jgi:DNA primase
MEQARCLLAITLAHPWLLGEVEEAFALLELPHGPPSALQAAMLAWHADRVMAEEAQGFTEPSNDGAASLDSADLLSHLDTTGLGEVRAWVMRATGLPREAGPDAQPGETLSGWWHFFGFLRGEGALVEDLVAAGRELETANDAAAQARVIRLSQALSALRRGETGLEEDAEGVAP